MSNPIINGYMQGMAMRQPQQNTGQQKMMGLMGLMMMANQAKRDKQMMMMYMNQNQKLEEESKEFQRYLEELLPKKDDPGTGGDSKESAQPEAEKSWLSRTHTFDTPEWMDKIGNALVTGTGELLLSSDDKPTEKYYNVPVDGTGKTAQMLRDIGDVRLKGTGIHRATSNSGREVWRVPQYFDPETLKKNAQSAEDDWNARVAETGKLGLKTGATLAAILATGGVSALAGAPASAWGAVTGGLNLVGNAGLAHEAARLTGDIGTEGKFERSNLELVLDALPVAVKGVAAANNVRKATKAAKAAQTTDDAMREIADVIDNANLDQYRTSVYNPRHPKPSTRTTTERPVNNSPFTMDGQGGVRVEGEFPSGTLNRVAGRVRQSNLKKALEELKVPGATKESRIAALADRIVENGGVTGFLEKSGSVKLMRQLRKNPELREIFDQASAQATKIVEMNKRIKPIENFLSGKNRELIEYANGPIRLSKKAQTRVKRVLSALEGKRIKDPEAFAAWAKANPELTAKLDDISALHSADGRSVFQNSIPSKPRPPKSPEEYGAPSQKPPPLKDAVSAKTQAPAATSQPATAAAKPAKEAVEEAAKPAATSWEKAFNDGDYTNGVTGFAVNYGNTWKNGNEVVKKALTETFDKNLSIMFAKAREAGKADVFKKETLARLKELAESSPDNADMFKSMMTIIEGLN